MIKRLILVFLLLNSSLLYANLDTTGRIGYEFGDSWVKVRLKLADSLRAHTLNSTNIDNSTWAQFYTYGQLGPKFDFYAQASVYTDISNRAFPFHDYQPYNGIAFNQQGSYERTWDWISTLSSYTLNDRIKVFAGLEHIKLGTAQRNGVIMRGNQHNFRPWQDTIRWNHIPAPMLQAGFAMNLGFINYEQWNAQPKYHKALDRYLHAHRLSAQLPGKIEVGLSEVVIYGSTVEAAGSNPNHDTDSLGRTVEWLYALPFVPYFFAEHYLGDRDNMAMALDLSVKTLPNWEFYGEFFLDDSKTPLSMLDDSWWGNKWALSAGLNWQRNYTHFSGEWNFEYTRIEPWVYTHHKGAAYEYTHYGQSLGGDLGPNAQEVFSQYSLSIPQAKLSISAAQVAKDTAFGSKISDLHTPEDPLDKKFLHPASTLRYRELGIEFTLYPTNFLWIGGGIWRYSGDYQGLRSAGQLGIVW